MCEIPSYYEAEGQIWHTTDAVINKHIRQHGGIFADYCGHSGLRRLSPEIPENAKPYEGVAVDTPASIINALESGKCNKMIKTGGLLLYKGSELSAPVLQTSGNIDLYKGSKLSAPDKIMEKIL